MAEKMSEMQQELLQRADAIFAKIAEAATAATDFAAAQLPDIAYQYIAFNRAYITFAIVSSIIIWVGFQVFMIKYNNKQAIKNYDKRWSADEGVPYVIGTIILTILCGDAFFGNIKDFFMVWFAPKIFLITNIVQMVKG